MGKRTCQEAVEKVYHYLDRELTWWKKARIRRHLKTCAPCRGAYGFEERLRVVVRERSQDDIPDDVVNRLREMLRDEAG